MLKLYSSYWKKTFNYKDSSGFKELVCAISLNLLILMSIYFIGLFGPIYLENVIVDLFYLILVIMLFPTLSLLIRVLRN